MNKAQKRIMSLGIKTGYLGARALTHGMGGLTPNLMHDNLMQEIRKWRTKRKKFPAWAKRLIKELDEGWGNEIVVYPCTYFDDRFEKGKDVVRYSRRSKISSEWVLPASYIPEEAIGMEKTGLFIDPEEVKEENNRVVVHPKSIVVLYPFIMKEKSGGKIDEATGIPLEVSEEEWESLPEEKKRWLWRSQHGGITPIVRHYRHQYRQTVDVRGAEKCGVSYVGPEEEEPIDVNALIAAAKISLKELSDMLETKRLDAIVRVVQILTKLMEEGQVK